MDVSYCPELASYQHLNREIAPSFHQPAEYASDLLCFCNNCTTANTLLDAFCEPEDQIDVDASSHLLPYYPNASDQLPLPPSEDIFPSHDELRYYGYPKRIKTADVGPCSSDYLFSGAVDAPVWNSCTGPGFLPELHQLPVDGGGGGEADGLKKPNGSSMSAQTVAARQRRKKISDKTHELGKLVPGGIKMNTADMYLAAFKYVKFMESQIGILKLMVSIKESKDPSEVQGLHALLSSSKMQERLYEQGKCLVSKELVEILAKEKQILSSPSVSKDLNSLLQ